MNAREIRLYAKSIVESAVNDSTWYHTDQTNYDSDTPEITESFYLGSLINPSGKYYLPFACSNVDACPRCKGKGCKYCGELGSREAYEDDLFYEYLDSYAEKYNCWIESGEGDPCDTFIVRLVNETIPELDA